MRKGLSLIVATVATLTFFGIPTEGRSQELVGNAEKGKKVVTEEIECIGCHTIAHQETGKKPVGPDLAMVGTRRSKEWLTQFLKDPSQFVEGTKMPVFDWASDQELADVLAYLISLQKPVDKEGALKAGSPVEAGKKLVGAYDCRACHRIGDGGLTGPAWRDKYPDLTHIGGKLKSEWMKAWMKDPQKVRPGTFMPTFGLTDKEIEAVVAYLSSLN